MPPANGVGEFFDDETNQRTSSKRRRFDFEGSDTVEKKGGVHSQPAAADLGPAMKEGRSNVLGPAFDPATDPAFNYARAPGFDPGAVFNFGAGLDFGAAIDPASSVGPDPAVNLDTALDLGLPWDAAVDDFGPDFDPGTHPAFNPGPPLDFTNPDLNFDPILDSYLAVDHGPNIDPEGHVNADGDQDLAGGN